MEQNKKIKIEIKNRSNYIKIFQKLISGDKDVIRTSRYLNTNPEVISYYLAWISCLELFKKQITGYENSEDATSVAKMIDDKLVEKDKSIPNFKKTLMELFKSKHDEWKNDFLNVISEEQSEAQEDDVDENILPNEAFEKLKKIFNKIFDEFYNLITDENNEDDLTHILKKYPKIVHNDIIHAITWCFCSHFYQDILNEKNQSSNEDTDLNTITNGYTWALCGWSFANLDQKKQNIENYLKSSEKLESLKKDINDFREICYTYFQKKVYRKVTSAFAVENNQKS